MLAFLDEAAAASADLVCYPELCVSGYLLDPAAYDDALLDAVERAEATLTDAAAAAGVALVYGAPARRPHGLANTVVHVAPDGSRDVYDKTHMDVKERVVFAPGSSFVTAGDGLGLACCYDLAFPEPTRMLALQGARVLLVPMAWEVARSFVLDKVAAARAVENVAYLVCVNQCGTVGPFHFRGASRVLDPLGETVRAARQRRGAGRRRHRPGPRRRAARPLRRAHLSAARRPAAGPVPGPVVSPSRRPRSRPSSRRRACPAAARA